MLNEPAVSGNDNNNNTKVRRNNTNHDAFGNNLKVGNGGRNNGQNSEN